MRRLLLVLLMLAVAGTVMAAAPSGRTPDPVKPAGTIIYTDPAGPRQAGDTIASATLIGSLPFHDTGTTVGYFNDYDEICPYSGSTSPDVVYKFDASSEVCVSIDLCPSGYDTKLYVYENAVGNLIACNDDASCTLAYRSFLPVVHFAPGNTYYIVVDGYGGSSGTYDITVSEVGCPPPVPPAPPIDCPAGALTECEPYSCGTNYVDNWDGGCNSTGWILVQGQDGTGCATMCGLSCTYTYYGANYRDTDWYEVVCAGSGVGVTGIGEFDLQILLFYSVVDCFSYQYLAVQTPAGTPGSLSQGMAAGETTWLWFGTYAASVPPNSRYTFTVCGIENGPTPTYNGACCNVDTGACTVTSESGCTGTYLGNCTFCDPNPCPAPATGACCLPGGACLVLTTAQCATGQGQYMGNNTVCTPDICTGTPVEVKSWGAVKHQYR